MNLRFETMYVCFIYFYFYFIVYYRKSTYCNGTISSSCGLQYLSQYYICGSNRQHIPKGFWEIVSLPYSCLNLFLISFVYAHEINLNLNWTGSKSSTKFRAFWHCALHEWLWLWLADKEIICCIYLVFA
jgi:hypothetical protein